MALFWDYFVLSFSALLPLINPIGSALIFVGLVGQVPVELYHSLSRRIAINTVLFLGIIDLIGSGLLRFFGISLPIVQVAGGLVIGAIGWSMLNQQGNEPSAEKMRGAEQVQTNELGSDLKHKTFYPFTFPITAGPGCIVVMLTLAAHTPQRPIRENLLAHAGLLLAILVLCLSVYFCYAHAHRIADRISPSTAHGVLRVMAFILLCIGVQIAWNGLAPLLSSLLHPA
ncbi:MAG TPA: MarC family protein [Acidobacteriaceae bacterium]|nr:MarC family protein [Acidobacteriaceae bacterium]